MDNILEKINNLILETISLGGSKHEVLATIRNAIKHHSEALGKVATDAERKFHARKIASLNKAKNKARLSKTFTNLRKNHVHFKPDGEQMKYSTGFKNFDDYSYEKRNAEYKRKSEEYKRKNEEYDRQYDEYKRKNEEARANSYDDSHERKYDDLYTDFYKNAKAYQRRKAYRILGGAALYSAGLIGTALYQKNKRDRENAGNIATGIKIGGGAAAAAYGAHKISKSTKK